MCDTAPGGGSGICGCRGPLMLLRPATVVTSLELGAAALGALAAHDHLVGGRLPLCIRPMGDAAGRTSRVCPFWLSVSARAGVFNVGEGKTTNGLRTFVDEGA